MASQDQSVDAAPHQCEPCEATFHNYQTLQGHLQTKRHRDRVSGRFGVNYCRACVMNVAQGFVGWAEHIQTQQHLKKTRKQGIAHDLEPEPARDMNGETYCRLCRVLVLSKVWSKHVQNTKHKAQVVYSQYQAAAFAAAQPKNGVNIEGDFDFGFVNPALLRPTLHAAIRSSSEGSNIYLVRVQFTSMERQMSSTWLPYVTNFGITVTQSNWAVTPLSPGHSLSLKITLKTGDIGRYADTAEFIFEDAELHERWIITKDLTAVVGTQLDHNILKPQTLYTPPLRTTTKVPSKVIKGIKPPSLNAIPYAGPLPKAPIPSQFLSLLSVGEVASGLAEKIRCLIPSPLTLKAYGTIFKHLLWIEEQKTEADLARYDLRNASLRREGRYYCLSIPGLAERRLSVLVGDCMLVQVQGSDNNRWFEGHVHFVRRDEVGLCFHTSFGGCHLASQRYYIRFQLNLIPQWRQHQALDDANNEERILFPQPQHLLQPTETPENLDLQLQNPMIALNHPQTQAIVSIVTARAGGSPFIVFGPPGTGKTVTIVEGIRQLLIKNPTARPSTFQASIEMNSSASTHPPAPEQVPNALQDYIYTTPEGHFTVHSMEEMLAFRVVVTTCISASVAHGIGIPRGHFSHIFVDEAGQATEPEVYVSIGLMADTQTNIVLSGDPKQLGPIIRSGIAQELGLDKSYLERLMEMEMYDTKLENANSVVKLIKNFRSHPAILKFPNDRFYEGNLEAYGEQAQINAYLNSPYLANTEFPLVFHSVPGQDEREGSSPSFFNADEVLQVKQYVKRLKADARFQTADEDIGIITPYHAQCLKLRLALRTVAEDVKVGSVEEFQGQEQKVVIISTVRSSREFVEYDLKHTLGFVANPRRFNVAVTRAKALLIVVGDPLVLSLDPLWRSFMNYVYLNGGWRGPEIPWDPTVPVDEFVDYAAEIREAAELDMNVFTRRMEATTLAEVDALNET